MTMRATFDTFEFIEALKASGVPEKQAKAQSKVMNKVLTDFQDQQLQDVATKADLLVIKNEIIAVKNELSKDIANSKAEILKWVAGMLIAQGAVTASLVKLL